MLAVVFAACILALTVLYIYWSFIGEVSKYRRLMNASAYNAQLYFDQREALLRSVAASAIRDTDHMRVARPRDLRRYCPDQRDASDRCHLRLWMGGAVLTLRNRANVAQLHARVVYITPGDIVVPHLPIRPAGGAESM
ncbi:hypothetical protein [Achromobacter sp. DH1f]|uniref:hypothetical protein n=1 Tax=Achromobacter sp. DH1f TaxID=1397275 RepID=UPI00046A122D|nr:hypothetical protein [Achromobacter sp. DH1f]